jgi:hypothetical protein
MTAPDQPHRVGAARLHEIAASLVEVGLVTHLHRTRAGTDLTATLHPAGHRDIQVIVDEDGYTELRYWASLSTTPSAAVTTIASALEALTTSKTLAIRAKQAHELVAGYDGAVTERAEGVGMTGSHDHLAEQRRIPDQARPHPADNPHDSQVRPDDLEARLERLPLNHPSSPYRDDGSRKPPPPDLTKSELPLPDEPDSPTDQGLSDQPNTAPDGSWDWKGWHLTPEQARAADHGLARCREAEGRDTEGNYGENGLTPAMRRIEAQLDHGKLVSNTEQFALKDPNRYKEKLAERIALQPDESADVLAASIHDGVRYTFEYDDEHYTEGVYETEARLEQQGFGLIIRRPRWDGEEYKGVNSQWLDPDSGLAFEIQFHTHASWEAKQKTHLAYEKLSDARTLPEEREDLRRFQCHVASSVLIPVGALEIPHYRKEGH